jgi:hypothetical protein
MLWNLIHLGLSIAVVFFLIQIYRLHVTIRDMLSKDRDMWMQKYQEEMQHRINRSFDESHKR